MTEVIFNKLFGLVFQSENYTAKVLSVDKDLNICLVLDDRTGTERRARLNVIEKVDDTQLVVYPVPNSLVTCGSIYNNRAQAVVLQVHSVDEISWKRGQRGGILIPDVFLQQLNKTNESVQAILDVFNNWSPIPMDGGTALKTLSSALLTGKTVGDFSNVQDDQFKL